MSITKYELEHAKNGWIFRRVGEDAETIVGVQGEDEFDGFISFLWDISEEFGPSSGKYSRRRIRIMTLPGNSYDGPLNPDERNKIEELRDECQALLDRGKDHT